MIYKDKLPLAPAGITINLTWQIDEGGGWETPEATINFDARKVLKFNDLTGRHEYLKGGGSTITQGNNPLTAEESQTLYGLLAKCFECPASRAQLGADE